MVKVYRYEGLGSADYGWLNARYHFNFAHYYNPSKTDFGTLCVINDDTISPHSGFQKHPHRDMEIITYVRAGAISHEDSKGNKGKTKAGEVQVMSAGSGIYHSEHNFEDEECRLYQIWIKPNKLHVEPRWDSKTFPTEYCTSSLNLLVSGDASDKNALFIHQDVKIHGGKIEKGSIITHNITHQVYILCSAGEVTINENKLSKGDGAEITEMNSLVIKAIENCEVIVIDVPSQ